MNKSLLFILAIILLVSMAGGCCGSIVPPGANPGAGSKTPAIPTLADNEGVLVLNTSGVFFQPNEKIDVGLVLWDKNKNLMDADVSLKVVDPDGNVLTVKGVKNSYDYLTSFTPEKTGTYVLTGVVDKPGYKILNDSLYIVVGQMSRLKISYNVSKDFDNMVIVSVYANGALTSCDAKITQDSKTESRYISDGKIYLFNCTRASVSVDKMMYEPAQLDYVKGSPP